MNNNHNILNLYVVRNKEGKFFRSKGFGGMGKSWVDNINQAKFYPKIGQAKSIITYYYKHHPEFGCPNLLVIFADVSQMQVIDMKEVTDKAIAKIDRQKLQREEAANLAQIAGLQRQAEEIQKRIDAANQKARQRA